MLVRVPEDNETYNNGGYLIFEVKRSRSFTRLWGVTSCHPIPEIVETSYELPKGSSHLQDCREPGGLG